MSSNRSAAPAMAALVCIAAVVRTIGLDEGLWYDEMVTMVEFGRRPFAEVVTKFPNLTHHPLYSLLATVSVHSIGEAAWTVRLPAVMFGVAAVPALYLLGRAVTTRRESLLAAALLTISYHHIWFSQNARGYSALVFWTIVSTYLVVRGLDRSEARWWIAYGVTAGLGLYTHLSMTTVVFAQAGVVALVGLTDQRPSGFDWRMPLLGFLLAAVVALVAYLPMLPAMADFFSKRKAPATTAFATPAWAIREAVRGLRLGLTGWGTAAAAALAVLGLLSYFRSHRTAFLLFVLPGISTALAAPLLRTPIRPRFFFLLIGFATLALVRGAAAAGRWLTGRLAEGRLPSTLLGDAIVASLILVSAVAVIRAAGEPKQDFLGALRFVEETRREPEPIVTAGVARYVYREFFHRPWPGLDGVDTFRRVRAGSGRVWVLYTLPEYIELESPELMAALRRDCEPVRAFPGTLGGGEVVFCVAGPIDRPAGGRMAR